MANRVLLNNSGLKVSKPGFDVLSAAPENMLFDTGTALAVHYTFTLSIVVGSGTYTTDVTFPSLGYVPTYVVQFATGAGTVNASQGWSGVLGSKASITSLTNCRVTGPNAGGWVRVVIFKNKGL